MTPSVGTSALLLRQRQRKFAVADARREPLDEFRDRVFAIGGDQFGQRREQAGLRQAVAVDAIVPRFRPGLVEIAERGLLLFVIRQRVADIENDAGWLMKPDRRCARSRAERV